VVTRYTDSKSKTDHVEEKSFLTPIKDDTLPVEWEESFETEVNPNDLETQPSDGAVFGSLPSIASKPKTLQQWNKDLVSWIFGNHNLTIYKSPLLKVCSHPGETEGEFRSRIAHLAHEERDRQVEKIKAKYAPKVNVLRDRLMRAEQAWQREQEQASQQTMQTFLSVGSSLLGAFLGNKKTSARSAVGAVSGVARRDGSRRSGAMWVEPKKRWKP
jgi:hypothetical protein